MIYYLFICIFFLISSPNNAHLIIQKFRQTFLQSIYNIYKIMFSYHFLNLYRPHRS